MTTTAPAPSHEVFISYSSKNKQWADAACAVLERQRIRCWVAPRDIVPGTEWGAAIIKGIDACKILVLIFSADANQSPQVRREVERAISKGLSVLPFRIEDIQPAGAMEFALSNTHWLDAFTPPVEQQLERLARSVKTLLEPAHKTANAVQVDSRAATPAVSTPPEPRKWSPLALPLVLVTLAIGLVVYFVLWRQVEPIPTSQASAIVSREPGTAPAKQAIETGNDSPIQVGSHVMAKSDTSGFEVPTGNVNPLKTVFRGDTGMVLEVKSELTRCLVKLDKDTRDEVWISIDALQAIK